MLMQPNHATLEGKVLDIVRSPDGHGAEVRFGISANLSRDSAADFTGARRGQVLTVFAAVPEALARGKRYRIDATVRGGPAGERVVIQRASELPAKAS